jgi:predicted metal-dependent enzyme (double-stranded beta helix superfamily)
MEPLFSEISGLFSEFETTKQELPFGRYLIYADENKRFNIQLDVFSKNYRGMIHAHGTWGLFGLLQGQLKVSDWEPSQERFRLIRKSLLQAGSSQCFTPPSEWHQVETPGDGEQTISIHIYGAAFDLDRGVYINDAGTQVQATRSPFKNLSSIEGFFRKKPAKSLNNLY